MAPLLKKKKGASKIGEGWDENEQKHASKKFMDSSRVQLPDHAKGVVNPKSEYMKRWDVVMVALMLYTALVTPFEVSFLSTGFNALFVLNRLVDFFFICDLLIQFVLPTWDPMEGSWEIRHSVIARNYFKSWFAVDLGSVLPFDTLGLVMESDNISQLKILRIIRLFRLAKLLRIFKTSRIFTRWESQIGISYAKMTVIKFVFLVFMISHWGACVWKLIIELEDNQEGGKPINWLNQYTDLPMSPADQYIVSLYWSVMTVTTIGYGDVQANTTGERVIAILSMVFGGAVYAYVIGSICGVISSMDPATTEFRTTLDELNLYMAENDLPKEMRVRLREYFQYCRQMQRNQHYHDLLVRMSPTLRGEVAVFINSLWVENVHFFNPRSRVEARTFITEISMCMKPEAYAPKEMLIRVGEPTEVMYIMQRGVVAMKGKIIGGGKFFGADMILHNAQRDYLVRALTYVDVYSLSKTHLEQVLQRNKLPETRQLIRQAALRLAFTKNILDYAKLLMAIDKSSNPKFDEHPHVLTHRKSCAVAKLLTGPNPQQGEQYLPAGLMEADRVMRRARFDKENQMRALMGQPPLTDRSLQLEVDQMGLPPLKGVNGGVSEVEGILSMGFMKFSASHASKSSEVNGTITPVEMVEGLRPEEREEAPLEGSPEPGASRRGQRYYASPSKVVPLQDSLPGQATSPASRIRHSESRRRVRDDGGYDNMSINSTMSGRSVVRRLGSASSVTGSPKTAAPTATASKVLGLLESRHLILMETLKKQSTEFGGKTGELEQGMQVLMAAQQASLSQWRLGLCLLFLIGVGAIAGFGYVAYTIQESVATLSSRIDVYTANTTHV